MINTLKNDMKQAMRDKNKEKLSTLRMLLASIETERSKAGLSSVEEFTEEQVMAFVRRNIRTLGQEIESLKNADRDFSKQEREIEVLNTYLPNQLDEKQLTEIIVTAVMHTQARGETFGDLMKHIKAQVNGQADMSLVSKIAKNEWNKQ